MSTPTVVDDTLAVATRLGLSVSLLPTWYDVDTPDELGRAAGEANPDSQFGQWLRRQSQAGHAFSRAPAGRTGGP
jgi:hypothetical protein